MRLGGKVNIQMLLALLWSMAMPMRLPPAAVIVELRRVRTVEKQDRNKEPAACHVRPVSFVERQPLRASRTRTAAKAPIPVPAAGCMGLLGRREDPRDP